MNIRAGRYALRAWVGSSILVSLLLGLVSCDVSPGGRMEDEARAKVLVDTAWVAQHHGDAAVRLLDLGRSHAQYAAGHIPDARYINWLSDITAPENPEMYLILSRERYEALMSRLGISPESTVVIYDDKSSRLSARMFWTMRYYGHQDLRILDGGIGAWTRSGRSLVAALPEVVPSDYRVSLVNSDYLAEQAYIEIHLGEPGFALVDGRPTPQYTGSEVGTVFHTGTAHQRLGHIYSAHNVPWALNFNEDGTFKSTAELRALYVPHEITEDKIVITYCNEGLHASPPWFVLKELLAYPDVRLYDASLAQWANQPDTMMVQGKLCM
ncbi:MAG: sulfurtransferase [Pseudomonadales bacterium]|nr:sulfurtransferase [Pseudomonadales bacterium]